VLHAAPSGVTTARGEERSPARRSPRGTGRRPRNARARPSCRPRGAPSVSRRPHRCGGGARVRGARASPPTPVARGVRCHRRSISPWSARGP